MPEEQTIAPPDEQQTPDPGKPKGQLPAEKAKELHGIVTKMVLAKEPEAKIKLVVEHYSKQYGTTAVATASEPTPDILAGQALPYGLVDFKSSAAVNTPQATQNVASAGAEAMNDLQDIVKEHGDDAVDRINKLNFDRQLGKQREIALAGGKVDNSLNQLDWTKEKGTPLAGAKANGQLNPLDWTNEKQAQERTNYYAKATEQPEVYYSQILRNIGNHHEDLKDRINTNLYTLSAQPRMDTNAPQIEQNIQELKDKKIKFNPLTGQLYKEDKNPFAYYGSSFTSGVKEYFNTDSDYEFLKSASPADKIEWLENKMRDNDPDKVTEGRSAIASSLGSLAIPMAKGVLGAAISIGTMGEAAPIAAPWVAAAFSNQDFARSEYVGSLPQVYARLRQQNPDMPKEQALAKAEEAAEFNSGVSSLVNFATAGVAGVGAGRTYAALSSTEKKVASDIIEKTITKTVPEITAASGVASLGRMLKNAHQGRPVTEGAGEEFVNNAVMMGLIHTLASGAGAIGRTTKEAREVSANALSKFPEDIIGANIARLVEINKLTPEQADGIWTDIKNQAKLNKNLPDDVPLENREQIRDLISKREALRWMIDPKNPNALDEVAAKGIKEKIEGEKKVNADGSTEGKDGINKQIEALMKPKKAEEFSTFADEGKVAKEPPPENRVSSETEEGSTRTIGEEKRIVEEPFDKAKKNEEVVTRKLDEETGEMREVKMKAAKAYVGLMKQYKNLNRIIKCLI